MVEQITFIIMFVWEQVIALVAVAAWLLLRSRWKIPVVILRYMGDKRRPTLLVTKARRTVWKGVKQLHIKGFKLPYRDFKSENYYPGQKGAQGALLLFEFQRGWLSPAIPKKTWDAMTDEQRGKLEEVFDYLENRATVKFEFNDDMFAHLKLQAIDDVDADYFLQQIERQADQYTGGLRDFLMKHGSSLALVVVAAIILVGYIVYLDKVPSISSQCISAGIDAAQNTFFKYANNTILGGVPLG